MKIKTYPLQFTEEYLKHIEEVAKKENRSASNFIEYLIEKWKKGE